ncbi:Calcipressin [Crucibulum laeve]|uniref:Calcipressin n=1 Tax=Crucibulum laeve TaxID=68775 RepID=A0A5C3LQB2_9AGAR|nr:Calcipressin [Crucibulum laeve]
MSYSISLPAIPSPPPSPPLPEPTNTLAVTSLPKSFFDPLIMDLLRDHFSSYGKINQWVPLPGFGRIIVVYEAEQQAELAKQQCDPIVLKGSHDRSEIILRVYRADPNPLIPRGQAQSWIPESNYLAPPAIEKNFLISPPGSPPVGWEPIKEDPPNSVPLAEDLIQALRRLQTHERRSSTEILLHPHEGSGVGVYVEDCDGEADQEIAEEDWIYGESAPARQKWRPVATAMPPMQAIMV